MLLQIEATLSGMAAVRMQRLRVNNNRCARDNPFAAALGEMTLKRFPVNSI